MNIFVSGLLAITLAAPFGVSQPPPRPITTVELGRGVSAEHWQAAAALRFLNRYTGRSELRFGRCTRSQTRCVRVVRAQLGRDRFAEAEPGWVRLAPRAFGLRTPAARVRLLVHELGHTLNLAHTPRCDTVMSPWIYCGGRGLVPLAFTREESDFLKSQ